MRWQYRSGDDSDIIGCRRYGTVGDPALGGSRQVLRSEGCALRERPQSAVDAVSRTAPAVL
jgi:hypothetical protein